MNTKIVYVVVSSPSDIYLEQAWASVWSLKHYNPDARVTFVMDDETFDGLRENTNRKGVLDYVDEPISIHFSEDISGKERSRILKTTLREIVKGDFLFIDSDTIIAASLSEIDTWHCHIGMVYDLHCRLSEYPFAELIRRESRYLYGDKLGDDTDQFNSGVIFAKDDQIAHEFYLKWHGNWEVSKKLTDFRDQPALIKTCDELPQVIEPINGIYNCQIVVSIAYLCNAKIIHFFNNPWKKSSISPFLDKKFYIGIKEKGGISTEVESIILNCKAEFYTPTMPITMDEVQIGRSDLYMMILKLYKSHKLLFRLLDWLCGFWRRVKKVPSLLGHICRTYLNNKNRHVKERRTKETNTRFDTRVLS